MSADIYHEVQCEDIDGTTRTYAIIGTYHITYEVETPDGTRRDMTGYDDDEAGVENWIEEDNQQFVEEQEYKRAEEEEEAEDDDQD